MCSLRSSFGLECILDPHLAQCSEPVLTKMSVCQVGLSILFSITLAFSEYGVRLVIKGIDTFITSECSLFDFFSPLANKVKVEYSFQLKQLNYEDF